MERFRDTGETVYSFQNEILVRCPRCQACAIVRCLEPDSRDWFAPRRFSCKACGAAKDWAERTIARAWNSEPRDDYFHYPLWLQAPCCGQTLWAYNLNHLDWIEAFVRADLRERQPNEQSGWSNRSLFSRLPKWLQSRKNRQEVMRAIAKIRTFKPE